MKKTIGILGLQGCVDPHLIHLKNIGVESLIVRTAEELEQVDGLIMPGGESSTTLRLIERNNLTTYLAAFCSSRPVWGICAGSILLAREVVNPKQFSFNAIAIRAHRNFYGSQQESFSAELQTSSSATQHMVDFIRAPKLEPLEETVTVLATHDADQILMRQKKILVSSFHTELREDSWLHDYFKSFL